MLQHFIAKYWMHFDRYIHYFGNVGCRLSVIYDWHFIFYASTFECNRKISVNIGCPLLLRYDRYLITLQYLNDIAKYWMHFRKYIQYFANFGCRLLLSHDQYLIVYVTTFECNCKISVTVGCHLLLRFGQYLIIYAIIFECNCKILNAFGRSRMAISNEGLGRKCLHIHSQIIFLLGILSLIFRFFDI